MNIEEYRKQLADLTIRFLDKLKKLSTLNSDNDFTLFDEWNNGLQLIYNNIENDGLALDLESELRVAQNSITDAQSIQIQEIDLRNDNALKKEKEERQKELSDFLKKGEEKFREKKAILEKRKDLLDSKDKVVTEKIKALSKSFSGDDFAKLKYIGKAKEKKLYQNSINTYGKFLETPNSKLNLIIGISLLKIQELKKHISDLK